MVSDRAPTGTTLDNRYELLTQVHTGTVTTVYRGRDLHTGQLVAVKAIVQPALGQSQSVVARFRREMALLTAIRHPNIVPVQAHGETPSGIVYFVMPWLEGYPLVRELDHAGQLPLARIQVLLRPICDAVAVIHATGIVHCDLKPGNVFLSRNADGSEHIRLLDLGIAQPFREIAAGGFGLPDPSGTVGTAAYMSPEQCRRQPLTPASDIYSLGVLLYRMLAGRLPFVGPSQFVLARHLADEPPPLSLFRPMLPEAVASVVACAMDKRATARFPTAHDLYASFEKAVGNVGEDVLYYRPQPPEVDEAGARYRTRKMAAVRLTGKEGASDDSEADACAPVE